MNERRIISIIGSMILGLSLTVAILFLVRNSALALSNTRYIAPGGDCGGATPCYSTIQAAVDAANNGDIIKIAEGTFTGNGFNVVYVSKGITITGGYSTADWDNSYPITQTTVIDAENIARRRGVYIEGTNIPTVTLAGLTIQNGYLPDDRGAGIYVITGTIVLQKISLLGNSTGAGTPCSGNCSGAGLAVINGHITIEDSLFANNNSNMDSGGGIYLANGVAILNRNSFRNNYARYFGGALLMGNGVLSISENLVQGNHSMYTGGGFELTGGYININSCIFRNNYVSNGDGGAIRVIEAADVDIIDSTFIANYGKYFGGAIYIDVESTKQVSIANGFFESNYNFGAYGSGGAIYVCGGSFNIHDSLLLNNHAVLEGGSIWIGEPYKPIDVTMERNTIMNNAASTGGAIVINGQEAGADINVTATNDVIANNDSSWGGVYVSHGDLTAKHWTLAQNGDYALTSTNGSVTLSNTIIASQTIGGLAGAGIVSDHTLFFNSGTPCSDGASCTNNLSGNPKFLDSSLGNYHLGPYSAAVDQGVDAGIYTDIDVDPRPMRDGFDLGADEQRELPIASFTSSNPDWLGHTSVFTNTTYSFGITTYQWNFGDEQLSNLENPIHEYSGPGVYTVVLTATNAAGSDTITHTINVYGKPSPGFIAQPTQGISPLIVTFTDTTTTIPAGDPTLTYFYIFGDGQTSDLPNPTHVYETIQTYTITQTVSNEAGTDSLTRTNYITVYEPALADFSGGPLSGVVPLSVTFTNLSKGNYTTCSWSFGDGSTSNDCSNPNHNYTNPAMYTVTLTVSGLGGNNTETKVDYITVYEPAVANFIGNPTLGIAPLSVTFTNYSTGDYSTCIWDFGDGSTSSNCSNPTHSYLQSGIYTVSLNISGLGSEDAESKVNYITIYEPVKTDFSCSPTSGTPPLTVAFTNLSTGDYSTCNWNFGDTFTSNLCSPSNHIYQYPGQYNVTLTVTGLGGVDTETKSNYITVYKPVQSNFTAVPIIGVVPLNVTFTNLSSGDYDTCNWNFGDGANSNKCNDPTHIYTELGKFTVTLTISGLGGTNTQSRNEYIQVMDLFSFYLPLTVR